MGSIQNALGTTTNTAGTSANTSDSASVRTPYPAAIPNVQNIYDWSSGLFNQGVNQTNPWISQGGGDIVNQATNVINNGTLSNPLNAASGRATGSPITPEMAGPLGQLAGNAANYGSIFNQAPGMFAQPQSWLGQAVGNLGGLASNTGGALTPTQQAILDQNAQRIGGEQASLYSGMGRYGSAGAGQGMTRAIAETNNPLTAQFNQAAIQNALGANQAIGSMAGQYGNLAGQQGQLQLGALGGQTSANAQQLNAILQGQQQQQGWASMLPSLYQASVAPGQNITAAGLAQQNYPWNQLSNYQQIMAGTSPLVGTSGLTAGTSSSSGATTGQTQQPASLSQLFGLGLAGAGMLSDRRMKTDIQKVGTDPWTELPLYAFRYKDDPKDYPKVIGPMAQDVKKKYPEAVGKAPDGMLYIVPDKLPWNSLPQVT